MAIRRVVVVTIHHSKLLLDRRKVEVKTHRLNICNRHITVKLDMVPTLTAIRIIVARTLIATWVNTHTVVRIMADTLAEKQECTVNLITATD